MIEQQRIADSKAADHAQRNAFDGFGVSAVPVIAFMLVTKGPCERCNVDAPGGYWHGKFVGLPGVAQVHHARDLCLRSADPVLPHQGCDRLLKFIESRSQLARHGLVQWPQVSLHQFMFEI